MSKRHLYQRTYTPAPAAPVVITIAGICAGFAISERGGFRFVGGHPSFNILDGSRFRRLDDLKNAAGHLFAAAHSSPAETGGLFPAHHSNPDTSRKGSTL